MNIVDYADLYAERAHQGQVRKYHGGPYIDHPRRVAAKLLLLNQDSRPEREQTYLDVAIAAALLHDVMEDCGVFFDALVRDFGYEVAKLVLNLTNTSKIDHPKASRAEQKRIDREKLSMCEPLVQSIKLADRIDNLQDLVGQDDNFLRVYLEESRLLLEALTRADVRLRQELSELIRQGLGQYLPLF